MPDLQDLMQMWSFVILCVSASAAPQSYLIVAALADADELLADVDSKSSMTWYNCIMQVLGRQTHLTYLD